MPLWETVERYNVTKKMHIHMMSYGKFRGFTFLRKLPTDFNFKPLAKTDVTLWGDLGVQWPASTKSNW